eukprot:jgi/Psemu1/61670/gm1.61670_g
MKEEEGAGGANEMNVSKEEPKEGPSEGAELIEKTVGMFPGEIIVLSGETKEKEPVLTNKTVVLVKRNGRGRNGVEEGEKQLSKDELQSVVLLYKEVLSTIKWASMVRYGDDGRGRKYG